MSEPVILSCTKTGRWWRCANDAAARCKARALGLVDYVIEPALSAPAEGEA